MNTAGHHSVAETAGLPLLEAAFARAGQSPRLAAFYMGNWLTDVSQAVDPVAYQGFYNKLTSFADLFTSTVDKLTGRGFDLGLLDSARTRLKAGCNDLLNAFSDYLGADQGFPRNSPLGKAVKSAFLIFGYFKFAHAGKGVQTKPMDFDAFMAVYDKYYTQYYPHEHLDRPEKPLGSGEFPYDIGNGTLNKSHKESLNPDLHKYLREDMQYVAGILAEIDHDFAKKYLTGKESSDDTDKEWNLKLAKLGHGLHAVEDFFAHSNFAEHAARALGGKFLPTTDRDATVFARRLKKFEKDKENEMDITKLEDEKHVVTGYFDFLDTAVSLSHIAEHLFHLDDTKPMDAYLKEGDEMFHSITGADHKAVAHAAEEEMNKEEKEFRKLFTDTLNFVTKPQDALNDQDNQVAKKYKDQYKDVSKPLPGTDVSRRVLMDFELLKDVPQPIKDNFVNAVDIFSRSKSVFGYSTSLFGVLTSIKEIMEAPVSFLEKAMNLVGLGFLAKVAIHAFKTFVYDNLLHQLRIGSHSLMAHDHGPEFLYKEQKNCALAVHYYIVKMLTRWSAPIPISAARAENSAAGTSQVNTVDSREWIDWLELLEYFLRHPAKPPAGSKSATVRTTLMHKVVKGDSLASLGDKYKSSAVDPAKFTWESIADANYHTGGLTRHNRQLQVNRYLKETGQGYLLTDNINYAWNLGIYVVIPDQRHSVAIAEPADPKNAWYQFVMNEGWEYFKKRTFHSPYYVKESDVVQLRDDGKSLIKDLESRYVPAGTAAAKAATSDQPEDRFAESGGNRVPHFSQGDPRWARELLGSTATLKAKGCAVTAAAMILKFYGRDVTPLSLDKYLDKNFGYDGNNVRWNTAFAYSTGGGPKLKFGPRITDKSQIKETLASRVYANKPTLARVDYLSDKDVAYNHFVVVVGQKADGSFILNDPASSSGNGAANPNADNTLEKTKRHGGYKIVQIDLVDPV